MKNLPFILISLLIIGGVLFTVFTAGKSSNINNTNKEENSMKPEVLSDSERLGKKAKFDTNQGSFTITLFGDKAPKTVSNFITLSKQGFYNNLIFHRVISGFMIQGGDPQGTGIGGPGYQFEDEFDPSLTFSKKGLLAMANSGPNTNGSQFFITVAQTPHLNNKHTIFGEVTEGYEVVEKISNTSVDDSDRPISEVKINKIEIQ